MGIISGAMSGFGEGVQRAGAQLGEYAKRSALQEEMSKIQAARDQILEGYAIAREGRAEEAVIRGETRKRDQAAAIGAEAEAARTGMVDDLSGQLRQRTASEGAQAEGAVYRKHGMILEAQRTQENERLRQKDAEDRSDKRSERNADNARADRQLNETRWYREASLGLQQQQLAQAKTLAEANRPLQTDRDGNYFFRNLKGEVEFLKGPDNQPLKSPKDASATDQIRAKAIMAQIEAVSRDVMMDSKAKQESIAALVSALPGGGSDGNRGPNEADISGLRSRAKIPAAIAHFEARYGQGSAARYLDVSPEIAARPGVRLPLVEEPPGARPIESAFEKRARERREAAAAREELNSARREEYGDSSH